MTRSAAQWLGVVLLVGAYLWQGTTNGWLHWGAISCAVLLLLNVLSLLTSKSNSP